MGSRESDVWWFRRLVGLILLAALCGTSWGGAYEEAMEAIERGDPGRAEALLLPEARRGHARAQYALGLMYLEGQGVEPDPDASFEWLRRSAEQGYAPAQYNLGNSYRQGRGVAADADKAAYWWSRAARQGLERAQHNLGLYWLMEQPEEARKRLGMAWLLAAADSGYDLAEKAVAKLREARPGGFRDHGWLFEPEAGEALILADSPDAHLIQLFASPDLEAVRRFLDQEDLLDKAHAFRFFRDRELWYAVAYGRYPDQETALSASRAMRPSLQRYGPWVRSYGDVQTMIEEVQADAAGR